MAIDGRGLVRVCTGSDLASWYRCTEGGTDIEVRIFPEITFEVFPSCRCVVWCVYDLVIRCGGLGGGGGGGLFLCRPGVVLGVVTPARLLVGGFDLGVWVQP
jgi:hypothetical protein